MAPPTQTPEEIQRQMAALRGALEQELDGVVDSARTLSDWRYHFRAHPAAFCAAAAAVGFVFAPGRRRRAGPEPQNESGSVETVSGAKQPEVETAASKSLLAVALGLAVNALARQATQVAATQGREMLAQYLAARAAARGAETPPQTERAEQPREMT